MPRKIERFTIGSETYECQALQYREGWNLYNRITKHMVPTLRQALTTDGLESNDAKALAIMLGVAENFPVELQDEMLDLFIKSTGVLRNNVAVPLSAGELADEIFSANYAHTRQFMFACMKVNFAGFLSGLTG